jgi:hypothetical protein
MRPFGPAATLFEARAHRRYFLVEKTWIFGLFCRARTSAGGGARVCI